MTQQDDLFAGPGSPSTSALAPVQVLPLGKYKGKPYDVLLTDSAYALWMLQSMYAKLEHQHPALFAFLISRFGPPDHTPVHNALQNMFLDEDFCLKFALASTPRLREAAAHLSQLKFDIGAHWRKNVRDCFAPCLRLSEYESNKTALARGTARFEAMRGALANEWSLLRLYGASREGAVPGNKCATYHFRGLEFEAEGADVSYRVELGYELVARRSPAVTGELRETAMLAQLDAQNILRIEVKPVVGDDYPAVLRRMKTARNNALLVEEFNGSGATWEQLVKVFALSHIRVVLLEDVARTEVPPGIHEFTFEPLTQARAHSILGQEFDAHVAALRELVAKRPEPDARKTGWSDDGPF